MTILLKAGSILCLWTEIKFLNLQGRILPLLIDQLALLCSTVCQAFHYYHSSVEFLDVFFFLIMTPLKFYYHRYIAYLCIYCMHLYNLYILSKIFCSSLRESIFVPLVPILPLLRTHALKKLKSCCLAVRLITLNNTFFKNSNMLSFTCTITLGETRRVMLYQQPWKYIHFFGGGTE